MAAPRPDTAGSLNVEKDSRHVTARSSADVASSLTQGHTKPTLESANSQQRNSRLFRRSKKSKDLAQTAGQSEKTGSSSAPVEQPKDVSILQLFR